MIKQAIKLLDINNLNKMLLSINIRFVTNFGLYNICLTKKFNI